MNIFKLKEIAKSRNILTCKLKKAEIVNLLEQPYEPFKKEETDIKDYTKMVTKDLKNEAKERGFNIYNNLKKNEIIKLFESHDL